MRLPFVARKELSRAEAERDEWMQRAITLAAELDRRPEPVAAPRRSRRATVLGIAWVLLLGVFIGGQLPHENDTPSLAPACYSD